MSSISCDETEFDKAKPAYEQALKNSGFNSTLTYAAPSQLKSSQSAKRNRQRKRNITWFNPPFDKKKSPLTLVDVFSNFLTYISMLDIHITGFSIEILWRCHIVVCQTWDQSSVVISIGSWSLRKRLLPHHVPATVINLTTALWKDTHCMGVQSVLYTATISAPNHTEKYYYCLSEPEFKSRYANHKSFLKYPSKRNTTELSKYYWELHDKGVDKKDIKVDWRIERQAHKYKCGTRRCDLCLTEKLVIALADKSTMLNKRSEIISACPHRTKNRYHKMTKVKMKQSCVLALCTQYRLLTLNAHSTLDIATMYIMLLTDCHMPFYTWTITLDLH